MKQQEMQDVLAKIKPNNVLKVTFKDSDLGGDLCMYLGKFIGNELLLFHGDDEIALDQVVSACDWGLSNRTYEVIVCDGFDTSSLEGMIDHGLFESIEIC